MAISNAKERSPGATPIYFILALILSISVAVFSYRSVQVFEDRAIWVEHTYGVLAKLEEAFSTLKDVSSNARGYVLTKNTDYLTAFEKSRDAVFPMLASLRKELHDNPEQLRKLDRLDVVVVQRVELSESLMAPSLSKDQAYIYTRGKELADEIRAIFTDMKQAETILLAKRAKETSTSARITNLAIVLGNLISLIILLLSYMRLIREIKKRRHDQLMTQKYAAATEDLYNKAPCGYHSVDLHGVIVKINDTELSWFGYTREEVVGKMRHRDLMTPESQAFYDQELFPVFMKRGYIKSVEINYRRKDGTFFSASANATTVRDDEGRYLMSRTVLYDITERKQAENQIRKLNTELSRHASQLENVNQELESFSYSVSHDLRAPLRIISGYALMLEEDCADKLDEEGVRLLAVIRKNVKKMDTLIIDLLKLSQSTRGELTVTSLDMGELVQQVADELNINDGRTQFILGALENASANTTLIRQVWVNFLSNAIKFSSKSVQPTICVSSIAGDNEVIYCVRDNGVGFDMRYAEKLFGTFQRLHTEEQFQGTGVGLALVKRIVTRHNGRVWAESALNDGASFYFSLPVENDHA